MTRESSSTYTELHATRRKSDVFAPNQKWEEETVECEGSPCLMSSTIIYRRDNSRGYWGAYKWAHGSAMVTVCDQAGVVHDYHQRCHRAMQG